MDRDSAIILELRVPRVLCGAMVGAALAISGAVLQALLRNPLADPYVLGISSGAALGAVLAILFGLGSVVLGSYAIPGAAFAGALLTLLFVYFLARVQGTSPGPDHASGRVYRQRFLSRYHYVPYFRYQRRASLPA